MTAPNLTAISQMDGESIWGFHDKLAEDCKKQKIEHYGPPCELEHYFTQPTVSRQSDPIQFWKTHQMVYPNLAPIAVEYLSVVATSVPAERLFSRAGNILDPCRSRLSNNTFSQILFLNSLDRSDWNI